MSVEVRPDRDRVFVIVRGELDFFSAMRLRQELIDLVAAGWRQVVVDLRELRFMDSGGVHVLLDARDGRFGEAGFTMLDGHSAASLPLTLLGLSRPLPLAPEER